MRILSLLKKAFGRTHGMFLLQEHKTPVAISDYYSEIFGDLEMHSLSDDKRNLIRDQKNLQKDLKKAFNLYKSRIA